MNALLCVVFFTLLTDRAIVDVPKYEVLEKSGWTSSELPEGALIEHQRGIVQARISGTKVPSVPRTSHVVLAGGDRLTCVLTGGDARRLNFKSAYEAQEFSLPLNMVAAYWCAGPDEEQLGLPNDYSWAAKSKQDSLLFKNRDTRRGLIERISADKLTLRAEDKSSDTYSVEALSAFAFDPQLVRERKPRAVFAAINLKDGSRLTCNTVVVKDSQLLVASVSGVELKIPLAQLVWLDIRGQNTNEPQPSLPVQTINSKTWGQVDRGFVMTKDADLTWICDKKTTKLYAHLILADDVIRPCMIQCIRDGKEVTEPITLSPGVVKPVEIDVRGTQTLTLRVVPSYSTAPPVQVIVASPYFAK